MRGLFVVVVLIAMLVSQITEQGQPRLTFSAGFAVSRIDGTEGASVSVHLSASVLTSIPINFGGSIEVDVTAEDLPGGATFGTDYLVNFTNPLSRMFTVSFLPLQANSTENTMQLSDDGIFEGTESFRLRIAQARFSGLAAEIYRADDTLTNAFADVNIVDDDFVEVNFTTSQPITVTEGDGMNVTLRGEAFGIYANPIEIGVICVPVDVSDGAAAFPNKDFSFTPGTRIRFTDVETPRSLSSNVLVVPIINDDIAEPCESLICTFQGGALDSVRGIEPNRVTIRICDDDQLVVRWANDSYEFGESDPATVQLVTDSVFESATVRIQGFPSQIPLNLNGSLHPNRLPSLSVCGPRVPGLIFNASIEQAQSELLGGVVFGNAQVTQSGRTDVVNTFNDFVFTPTNKSAFENFTIVDDDVLEFDEMLIAEFNFGPAILNGGWNVVKGEPSTAFILIRDDDTVVVNFNEDSYTVAESTGQVSVSLRINGQYFVPVWAIVEIMDGTATGGLCKTCTDPEDYSSAVLYNVTFCQTAVTDTQAPARSTVSSPILIGITNDDIFEGVEYFQARIVETSDRFRVRISQDIVNVTITDSVTVRFEEEQYCVVEKTGYVTPALILDGDTSVPVTVTVRTLDLLNSSIGHAATASVDYIPRGPFGITFQPGSTRKLFNVTIVDDGILENFEFFNADIVSAGQAGVIIREPRQPFIEIQDRVDFVTVQFVEEQYRVEEEVGPVTLALVLNKAVSFPVTVIVNTLDLQDSSVGNAATANVDYTPRGPFEITFPPGSTRQEYTVNIIDDFLPENSEFFNANVNARPVDACIVVIRYPSQPLIEIQDLRDIAGVYFDPDVYSVNEGGTVTLTLRTNVTVNKRFSVLVNTRDDSANSPADYQGGERRAIFEIGSSMASVEYSTVNDSIREGIESFSTELTVPPGMQAMGIVSGMPDRATVNIIDDEVLVCMLVRTMHEVREDMGPLVAMVMCSVPSEDPFTLIVQTSDGSAVDGQDYTGGDFSVIFPAGSTKANFSIPITDDDIFETDETFLLTLVIPQPAQDIGVMRGVLFMCNVTIINDDVIELTFNPTQYSVSEGDRDVVLTLLASQPASFDYTVHVDTVNGTAVGGLDFQSSSYQVTFLAGETTAYVSIPITDDTTAEVTEAFSAAQTIPAAATAQGITKGTADTATIDIMDNDPVEVVFNPTQYTVNEGTGVVTLTLNADKLASFEYTVEVETQDGTATRGKDYAGKGFLVAFPIGDTVTSFNIAIVDDDVVEASEQFSLHLDISDEAASSGITKGTQYATANVTIVNDDGTWSPWLKGSCSTLPCGGVGVRTDVRLCTSPIPSDGRVHCRGEQWRNTTCFTCPCGGGWSSWSEGVCSENRHGQRVREDSRICNTPDHPECCHGLRTRTSPCPASAVHGGWSAWNVGYCSKTCGGSGVRTDWRACNNPPPLLGGDLCRGPASRTMPCYTCPCGSGWSNWVEGTCSKTCGLGTRLDRRHCTTPGHQECCPGCGLRQSNCSVAECPVHGGWSSWLEVTSCSVSCGGGTKFLVRECNNPVPAHGGSDCDGVPYGVESCNTCPCDAGWSSWVPGACGAPCGQNGTAMATRKCRGPSECCPGKGKRTEVCTSPPCQGR